jgi:mxaK protein
MICQSNEKQKKSFISCFARATSDGIAQTWRKWRSTMLILCAAAFTAAAALSAALWRSAASSNEAIEALRTGHDEQVDEKAAPELLLARIAFLIQHDEIDRARGILEALDRSENNSLRAKGHYLLANALLRKGFELIEKSEFDAASPLVNLSKREYRSSLQLEPRFWDAKFNFDVATRLLRDHPMYEQQGEDDLNATPKNLWTDVPGTPEGLP